MYKEQVEDTEHFILQCKALDESREIHLRSFKETVDGIKGDGAELLIKK